jgi:ATP-dependent helicase Lhr and Lhr-like helicase
MNSPEFDLLHPEVQGVVYDFRWQALRPVQAQAFREYYHTSDDLLFIAPTAGGKTEAVYLPAISDILSNPRPSVQVLCILPLKALINDQYRRLTDLTKRLKIPVERWHGDVSNDRKQKVRKHSRGILLITPESLEAAVMNRSGEIPNLFGHLQLIVIDEVHALLESERGIHVRSLLARLCALIGRRPRLIGLSATIGDTQVARSFMNPDHPESVRIIEDTDQSREIKVALVAYVQNGRLAADGEERSDSNPFVTLDALASIAEDIAAVTRGTSNLGFANSRHDVERLSHLLHRIAKEENWPFDPFQCHHKSLSKEVREAAEAALKSGQPVVVFATSSLELGIDLGDIARVLQVDPCPTVSSLRQRTGRSGRKEGQASTLRLYTRDILPIRDVTLSDRLHPGLLRGVALVELMLADQLEPNDGQNLHLSTLVHQCLSTIRQWGAITAENLYRSLCVVGPFRNVPPELFIDVLHDLSREDLIVQDTEQALVLGRKGETVTGNFEFFAAFITSVEYTVSHHQDAIGKLQASVLPPTGQRIVLAGRYWRVEAIDHRSKVVEVVPTQAGAVPMFLGDSADIHTIVFKRMQAVLRSREVPGYLHPFAQSLLAGAREAAASAGLHEREVLVGDNAISWFAWQGTRVTRTLVLLAAKDGLPCQKVGLALVYPTCSVERFKQHLKMILAGQVKPLQLAAQIMPKVIEKFDQYLSNAVLDRANAVSRLDLRAAEEAAQVAITELETAPA